MRIITSLMVAAALMSGTSYAKNKAALFNEVNLTTELTLSHPIYPLDLLPNPGKELLLIGTLDNQQFIEVFATSEQNLYNRMKRIAVPNKFHGFDFTEYDNAKQQVYFLSSDEIALLNLEGGASIEPQVNINTYLQKDSSQHLSRIEFVHDINSDKVAEFLTTDFTNSYLYKKEGKGYQTFSLNLPARVELDGDSAEIKAPRFALFDTNEDKHQEIIEFEQGKLSLFSSSTMPHSSTPKKSQQVIKMRDDIMVDDWWHSRGADGQQLDQSNLVYRKLERVEDVNNDGVFDLVVRYTKSQGALDRQNDYEIYLGSIENGAISFSQDTASVIRDDGTLTDLQFVDIEGDEQLEALVSGFDIGISQIIGALLSGSVSQDVHLFYMDEQGNFNKDDKVTREVELSFSISKGRSGSAVVLFADVNGDGKKDWVLSDEQKAVKVYFAESNKRFSRRATKYKTVLPMQGRRVVTSDLNQDGKDDLLMTFGRLDEDTMRNTIKILFASR